MGTNTHFKHNTGLRQCLFSQKSAVAWRSHRSLMCLCVFVHLWMHTVLLTPLTENRVSIIDALPFNQTSEELLHVEFYTVLHQVSLHAHESARAHTHTHMPLLYDLHTTLIDFFTQSFITFCLNLSLIDYVCLSSCRSVCQSVASSLSALCRNRCTGCCRVTLYPSANQKHKYK